MPFDFENIFFRRIITQETCFTFSSFSKHKMRPHFSDSERFPVSANPFKMSTAKAITLQSTSIGCCCTLDRVIPEAISLHLARHRFASKILQIWIGMKVNCNSIQSNLCITSIWTKFLWSL